MNPFLTGSYAYGQPDGKSDVDLVIFVDEATFDVLLTMRDVPEDESKYEGLPNTCKPMRFGNLNLLVCTDPIAFGVWQRGTTDLEAVKPVSRDVAVKHFRKLRRFHGVHQPALKPELE